MLTTEGQCQDCKSILIYSQNEHMTQSKVGKNKQLNAIIKTDMTMT
jgi:hypothetical protein